MISPTLTDISLHAAQRAVPAPVEKLIFGPFRLDCINAQLWKNDQQLSLTPKAFAVLTQLARSNGCLVSKDELLDSVWSGTIVGEAALTVCIREIRKELGDSARAPQYIATAHKRGYRFVAQVSHSGAAASGNELFGAHAVQPADKLIGRESETTCLHEALTHAVQGQRQCVFVTGSAGLGKTTLVAACLRAFSHVAGIRFARGQCVEHHGHCEPYLPWLDAMTRLCLHDEEALAVFRRFAPMWLLQTPALLNSDERSELERQLSGASPGRMMREMSEALQALSQRPLVICLDDLHCSDAASVELLAFIARRQDPARLLIIACYRPVAVVVDNHPLKTIKQELQVRGQCLEIALQSFSKRHVASYIEMRFPDNALCEDIAEAIHMRTDGNPLFTVNVIKYLRNQQWLHKVDDRWQLSCDLHTVKNCVPESLVQMLGYHIEQLPAEVQVILQAAAVASDVGAGNVRFSSVEVAAALREQTDRVEEHCDLLAQQGHFLHSVESARWPDGTLLVNYTFSHGLYQKAFYRRITAGKRALWHQRIGERMALACNARDTDVAAELAVHFEQGRDFARAAAYLQVSAATASQRGANEQAKNDLHVGLSLAERLPEGLVRTRLEMQLYAALGTVSVAGAGNAAPEVESYYRKAHALSEQLGDTATKFPILFGLRSCSLLAGRLQEAHELGQQLLVLAENISDADLVTEAHVALASTAFFLGHFRQSLAHSSAGIESYNLERHAFHVTQYGLDPGVFCRCRAAQSLWSLGYPEQALRQVESALNAAQQLAHPYSLVFALNNQAWISMHRREARLAEQQAQRAVQLATEHGFPFHVAWGQVMHGWALTTQGEQSTGLALISEGLAAPTVLANGVRSYLLTVCADAQLKAGNYDQGLAALDEIAPGAEFFLQAERLRLRGSLMLSAGRQDGAQTAAAEEYMQQALQFARRQHAKSLALRAALSLTEHYGQQRGTQAKAILEPLVTWFNEGHATLDLVEARALLGVLESSTSRATATDSV